MLLTRRDLERSIGDGTANFFRFEDKLHVLGELAHWFTINNVASMPTPRVIQKIAASLRGAGDVNIDARQAYNHLVLRSGILRQPAEGRTDFIHKTFQELLAAWWVIESDSIEMLLDNLSNPNFHEVIVMALGLARPNEQNFFVEELLERIEATRGDAKDELCLLIARCLETANRLESDIYEDVMAEMAAILPPRSIDEARNLVSSGADIVRLLPTEGLSTKEAIACLRAAGLTGGQRALNYICKVASQHLFSSVGDELVANWKYFDSSEYARTVFQNSAVGSTTLVVGDPFTLAGVNDSPFDSVICELSSEVTANDLQAVGAVRNLRGVRLADCPSVIDFEWLSSAPLVTDVSALGCRNLKDISGLISLPRLSTLQLLDPSTRLPLKSVSLLRPLESLEIGPISAASLTSIVAGLPRIKSLRVVECRGLDSISGLGSNATVERLVFQDCDIREVADLTGFPALKELYLVDCRSLTEFSVASAAESLRILAIHWCESMDILSGMRSTPHLCDLSLKGLKRLSDLSPLASLHDLRRLRISDCVNVCSSSALYESVTIEEIDARGRGAQTPPALRARLPKLRDMTESTAKIFLTSYDYY